MKNWWKVLPGIGIGMLLLGAWTVGAAAVIPPPPAALAVTAQALLETTPGLWPVVSAGAEGDTLTVCLQVPPEILRADDGLGAEQVADNVTALLTPLQWRVLHVQARDPADGVCKPLTDFLPATPQTKSTVQSVATLQPAAAPLAAEFPSSLAGKTVYLSAGHGWQWNGSAWRTQRPPYQDIIEDHNNAEAVTQFLIPYLENAGATVIPVRERDWNTERTIADNDIAGDYTDVGTWYTSALPGYHGDSYRFAHTVTGTATATATWTLTVPQAGTYALYAWVDSDPNRACDAHYTVQHAGGPSPAYLDQRIRPQTWRYLGTFPCYAGPLTVTLDNHSSATGDYLIADALRLGSGRFDNLTAGTGQPISTTATTTPDKPWWEVATFYYSQWMGLDRADWPYFNDVVARPMYARWQHAGVAEDAVYLSWHTNGYNGHNDVISGTVSYVHNGETYPRTAGSLELQNAVHTELLRDIRAGWESDWPDLNQRQLNLGEMRMLWDDDPARRLPGTLVEIAYHDNVHDANALKDPRFNQLAARAIYQGILHYFETQNGVDLVESPEPPTHLRVQNLGGDAVRVAWNPSPTDTVGLRGAPATGYRVYTSPDGFAWGQPLAVTDSQATLTGFSTGETLYVRVTATNDGGKSFPTEVLGTRVGAMPPLLIVNGFDKCNRFGLVQEIDPVEGYNLRMWLRQINSRAYVVHHGAAVPISYTWDSASNEAIAAGLISLSSYSLVDWVLGEESTEEDGTLNATEQAALTDFVQHGGALLISGSELLWDLVEQGHGLTFAAETLHTGYTADDAATYHVTPAETGAFAGGEAFYFDAPGEYDADSPDVPTPLAGAQAALYYDGQTDGVAAVQHANGCTRTLVLGFPFEAIRPAARPTVMARALDFLAACLERTQIYLPLVLRNYPASEPPPQCETLLEDGFESVGDWGYGTQAERVQDTVHEGLWAARVGIPPGEPGGDTAVYSSIWHTLTLPGDATEITLHYWGYPSAEENDPGDFHYVGLRDADNVWHSLATDREDSRTWQAYTQELSAFAGQTVTLYFGTKNDGDAAVAALYVDDVVVEACR